ncbi:MAG: hypothetical protein GF388_12330, partial [Candidatus Aegiribacteria sp.]|nr:hypothetical protein [Candidatus Aegiribacteria sp.]
MVLSDHREFNRLLSWLGLEVMGEGDFAELLEDCGYEPKFQKGKASKPAVSSTEKGTLINVVYGHTEFPGHAVHKGRASVIWSCDPMKGCDVYAYIGAFSYQGPRPGWDVLVSLEPIVVLPGEYSQRVWERFDHVLTLVDTLAERGQKFTKIYYPAFDAPGTKHSARSKDLSYGKNTSEKKNAICMISGNKNSSVPGELYSRRIEAAQWFQEHSDIPFDVFGRPPFLHLPNYRGELTPHSQKFVTLAEYRYSLCFENIYDPLWSKGYMTEKLLDCLMCGTVPIYLGCYNVEEYIPPECFIDFRTFKDYSELDEFLHGISDSEYSDYIRCIHNWVEAGNLSRFSMNRIYDKLLSLTAAMDYEENPGSQQWESGLARIHAKCNLQADKSRPIWSWESLAFQMLQKGILHGDFVSVDLEHEHALTRQGRDDDEAEAEKEAKTILLSYPRSGNTWLRYCIEFLTKRPTRSYNPDDNTPINTGLGRFVDIDIDYDAPPIVYKTHGHRYNEKQSYDMDNDKLIVLVRNYKECLVRHHIGGAGSLDRKFYAQTQGYRDGETDYIGYFQIYEQWQGKKILIYYEDLITDLEAELLKVLKLLEYDGSYLRELMDNIGFHKKQSIGLYSKNPPTIASASFTKGDSDKLIFHSQKLTDKQKREWDRHLEEKFPDILQKYLRRYQEPDPVEASGVRGIVFSKDRAMQLDAT